MYEMRDLREFMERNAWLYASLGELEEGRDRLRTKILSKKNPLALDLEDDSEESSLTQAIQQRHPRNPLDKRFPDGTFSQGDFTWVVVLPSDTAGVFQERAGEQLCDFRANCSTAISVFNFPFSELGIWNLIIDVGLNGFG